MTLSSSLPFLYCNSGSDFTSLLKGLQTQNKVTSAPHSAQHRASVKKTSALLSPELPKEQKEAGGSKDYLVVRQNLNNFLALSLGPCSDAMQPHFL